MHFGLTNPRSGLQASVRVFQYAAVSRARNVCRKSAPGEYSTVDDLAQYAEQEFHDGDTPSVSSATANAIIDVVRSSTWCRHCMSGTQWPRHLVRNVE